MDGQSGTRTIVAHKVYRAVLRLYPTGFRGRFGQEMSDVFEQAFAERLRRGFGPALGVLVQEILDAPGCIAREHIAERSPGDAAGIAGGYAAGYAGPLAASHPRLWSSLVSALAFGVGFFLLGVTDVLRETYGNGELERLGLSGILCAGGFGGLGLGLIMDARKKGLFVLWGAVGFLFAQVFINCLYEGIFPNAMSTPAMSLQDLLIAFLYPLGMGCVFGLIIGAASLRGKCMLPFMVSGGLALMAGFFTNRLSAALMQSYLLPAPAGGIPSPEGGWLLLYILVPYLLEGVLLGALLGPAARRSTFAST